MVIWAALGQSVGHLNPPRSQKSIKAREGIIVSSLLGRLLLHRRGDHSGHWDSGLLGGCGVEGEVKEAVVEAAQVTPGGTDSSGG